jgi:hypothetical protein
MKLLTVIPAGAAYGEPARTKGTKVVDQEGNEIEGVTRIELVAEFDDVWRATITCNAQVGGPIYAETEVIDVTNLSSDSVEYSPAKRLALKLGKDRLEHFHAVEEARLNADIANAGLKWKPTAWYRRVWRRVRDAL